MTEISYQSCCISNKKRGFRGRHKRSPYPHQSNYLAVSRQAVLLKKFSGLMYGRLANETLFRRSSTVDPSRTEKHRQESPQFGVLSKVHKVERDQCRFLQIYCCG